MSSVLILGFDPHAVPGTDGAPLRVALDGELARFADHALDASVTLLPADASAVSVAVAALTEREWDVVVIGGGIRKPEGALLFFEQVVNLVREHAPGAALAFNSGVGDTFEAARRRLPAAP
ncbi:hypothetical protein MMF93_09140 [Streptomyces tubbatahanensis]|uniref:Uncharacterized protein n=1 Tax=Streptomyces tubbatahanensis TaxID=2923272 RepID=A0ABY3XQC6_9ACTN|nr:hypothetical protein [Streptomyces tubbatahanensis]UNS96658.1 hypothetical protein MMF93_09140 [Streptomyces tubbatahanensis]